MTKTNPDNFRTFKEWQIEVYCEFPIISVLKGIQSCSVEWWYCFVLEIRKSHMNGFIITLKLQAFVY